MKDHKLFQYFFIVVLSITFLTTAEAQKYKKEVIKNLDSQTEKYGKIAHQIWDWAELGYLEEKSSALLQKTLKDAGFTVQAGVAEIPTAFVASYGSGSPVIGILAEFDALPGLSQAIVTHKEPVVAEGSGHGCGHHLLGTGGVAAAIEVKNWLESSGKSGTIRLYGTPAEEGGAGKVYMVRAGLFDDTDVVIHWHPADVNAATPSTSLANISAKFKFHGVSSHAALSPDRGRSALDGVEAMNMMANMMREHIPDKARMHYVITKGGMAPNVVPDFAEVYYYVRHPNQDEARAIFNRLVKIAEGAAMGTGTKMDFEISHGIFNVLPNEALAEIMHKNLEVVGGVHYNDKETDFAKEIIKTYNGKRPPESAAKVIPYGPVHQGMFSTDVGDISWVVPTVGLSAATWVPGTTAHSWQAVAVGGMSIGEKGMMVAAKTLALTAIELMNSPKVITAAKQELEKKRGQDFKYKALLGDRKPPLGYRK
ncbi:MAG: amidohydrolase [Bacteroidota bacterium]